MARRYCVYPCQPVRIAEDIVVNRLFVFSTYLLYYAVRKFVWCKYRSGYKSAKHQTVRNGHREQSVVVLVALVLFMSRFLTSLFSIINHTITLPQTSQTAGDGSAPYINICETTNADGQHSGKKPDDDDHSSNESSNRVGRTLDNVHASRVGGRDCQSESNESESKQSESKEPPIHGGVEGSHQDENIDATPTLRDQFMALEPEDQLQVRCC